MASLRCGALAAIITLPAMITVLAIVSLPASVLLPQLIAADRQSPARGPAPSPVAARSEAYYRQRLGQSGTSADERAAFAIELAKLLSRRALETPFEKRQPLWDEALKVLSTALGGDDLTGSRALAVRMESALVQLARGEAERQETAVTGRDVLLEGPRRTLGAAVAELEGLNRDLAAQLKRGSGKPTAAATAAERELSASRTRVEYQLARALRNRALCSPRGSADRAASLRRATELLRTLGQLPDAHPLAWPGRIDELACYRLLGDYDRAASTLKALEAREASGEVRRQLVCEKLRLALDQGQVDEALLAIDQSPASAMPASTEWEITVLESYLAAWQRAAERGEKSEAGTWEQKAVDQVARIERLHGMVSTRQAENLLTVAIAKAPGTENLGALTRAGDTFYRQGRADDALEVYDRAAAIAADRHDRTAAFDLAFKAATLEHDRQHHAPAATRYRRLALEQSDHARAAEAHLLAIFHAGQGASARGSLDGYRQLLEEHLAQWPMSPTAGEAAWRLGLVHEHLRQWPEAIGAYRRVPRAHARMPTAAEATARCYEAWLKVKQQSGESTTQLADQAVRELEALAQASSQKSATASMVRRASLLASARLAFFWQADKKLFLCFFVDVGKVRIPEFYSTNTF